MKLELKQEIENPAANAAPLTLWLVDDDTVYRQSLAELFAQTTAGHSINCARTFPSAEAVLAALAIEPAPDVILSDVRMRGGMTGVDSVALIKQLAPQTRVILLTTFYDSRAALQAHQNGAAAFLLKRYTFEQIAGFVRDPRAARGQFNLSPRLDEAVWHNSYCAPIRAQPPGVFRQLWRVWNYWRTAVWRWLQPTAPAPKH